MAEDLKALIEKIHEEGVKAAEDKAKEIESEAERRARAIVDKAEKKAQKIIADANSEAERTAKSTEASLRQAARDAIIALKKDIQAVLDRLIALEVRKELTPETVAKAISALIKDSKDKEVSDIVVSLGREDLKRIEEGLLKKLKDVSEKGITLKARDDIQAGFVISYDSGRSQYDFTDKALAEYIGRYLRPKLRDLLNGEKSD